ncbi:MAG: aminotransferase class I/II-fold pyridoxal phosphate-dependent enzyme, partial [FCB group bacterium]|nr:aminotransferase class I/II-fold pyridoxal phosphate-dependent enzyme [FCB group bacterium]
MNALAVELNERLALLAPSIYRMLSQKGRESYFPKTGILAQSMQAKGTAINATIGIALEDDGSPLHFRSMEPLITLDPARVFPYAGCLGLPDLRKKWKDMQLQKNPALEGKITSLPVVTCALSHGLSIAGMLFLDPGDTVIIADMYWGNYNMLFKERFDVRFDIYPFYEGSGMNLRGLEKRLMSDPVGKKVMVLNFPNNPTGYTPTKSEMREMVKLIAASADKGNDIVVICDDAYFGLVYENDVETQSPFAYLADLHERLLAVKLDGATKEDYVWGFRTGFITFATKGMVPETGEIMESKVAGGIRSSISSSPHISQSLLLEAYRDPKYHEEKREKYALLKSRYETVRAVLAKHGERYATYFTPLPFNSGYFMCVALAEGLDGNLVRRT